MTLYDSMMYTDGYKIKEPTSVVGSFILQFGVTKRTFGYENMLRKSLIIEQGNVVEARIYNISIHISVWC